MKLILVCCFSVFLFLILSSCDTNEPLPQGAVGLTLEDVSCTEAWITLTTGNLSNTAYIKIMSNGKLLQTLDVSATKTLLYYDTLQPNTTYEFQAFSSQRDEDIIGNKLQVTTLDTTSHNFTWHTFEFGQHNSSILYDVAIIDENNIWAVGEIYMNGSLGNPDPTCYNAVHWDGQGWELKRIKTKACGGVDYPPIKTIFAFSMNDILFAHIDGSISHFNGIEFTNDCSLIIQLNGSANKIWGISKNDFYVVSGNGFIARFKNGNWAKIESGTTTNINDAWGVFENGTSTVYCPVSSIFNPPQDKKILKITNSNVDSLSWNKDRILYGCWTNSNNYLFVCGSGVYNNKSGQWYQENLPAISMNSIRGNALNDIFLIGDFGFAAHFNGVNWQIYNENFGDVYSLTIKNDVVSFVGQKNGYGYIVVGKRN